MSEVTALAERVEHLRQLFTTFNGGSFIGEKIIELSNNKTVVVHRYSQNGVVQNSKFKGFSHQ